MVIPTPMMAIIDIWRKILTKFRSVKKGPSLSGVANRLVALEEFGAAEPVG